MKSIHIILLSAAGLIVLAILYFAAPQIQVAFTNLFYTRPVIIKVDTPWAASHQHAHYYAKQKYSFNNGVTEIWEWGSDSRHRENPKKTVEDAIFFLDRQPNMKTWPYSGGISEFYEDSPLGIPRGEYPRRIAPYRFYLVSVEPTIVMMQAAPDLVEMWKEHEATGHAANSRFSQWYGSLAPDQIHTSALLENPIEFGTQLPAGTEWLWFSPDLPQAPTTLSLQNPSTAFIPLKNEKLVFEATTSGWKVLRK